MNIKEIIIDLQARLRGLNSDIKVSQPDKDREEILVHVEGYFEPQELSEIVITMFRHNLVASGDDTHDGENGLILYKTV